MTRKPRKTQPHGFADARAMELGIAELAEQATDAKILYLLEWWSLTALGAQFGMHASILNSFNQNPDLRPLLWEHRHDHWHSSCAHGFHSSFPITVYGSFCTFYTSTSLSLLSYDTSTHGVFFVESLVSGSVSPGVVETCPHRTGQTVHRSFMRVSRSSETQVCAVRCAVLFKDVSKIVSPHFCIECRLGYPKRPSVDLHDDRDWKAHKGRCRPAP